MDLKFKKLDDVLLFNNEINVVLGHCTYRLWRNTIEMVGFNFKKLDDVLLFDN